MELRDYLRVLRRGWLIFFAVTVIGLAVGIGLAVATTTVYRAGVQIFVAVDSPGAGASALAQGNNFVQERVQSYTSIATSPAVTGPVITEMGLSITDQNLAKRISASAPPNKVLINLYVTDHDPQVATDLANAVAASFDQVVEQTEQTDANGKPVVRLTVIHPATVPHSPVKPNKPLDVGLGFIIGLLVGMGLVVLRHLLDNTVPGQLGLQDLGAPVLGTIPLDKTTPKQPVAFRHDPHSARSEAFRTLRTNLQFVNIGNVPKVIAVTSAVPGEGKSTTAVNLAAALAEAGSTVCLIEADFRRPSIPGMLGLLPDIGFTTVLIGKAKLADVLQGAGKNFGVLTSGPVPPNPTELLISKQARSVIAEVSRVVDYTIIDCAPLVAVADGAEIAALADATIVVYRAGKTTWDQVAKSAATLERVGKKPVGIVLNMVTRRAGGASYDFDYYSYQHGGSRDQAATPPPISTPNGAGDAGPIGDPTSAPSMS